MHESDVLPGSPSVGRFVDTVSVRYVATDSRFAGAGVDNVGIGRSDRDGANSGSTKESIGDVFPIYSGVCAFPHTSSTRPVVEHAWVTWIASHRYDASS